MVSFFFFNLVELCASFPDCAFLSRSDKLYPPVKSQLTHVVNSHICSKMEHTTIPAKGQCSFLLGLHGYKTAENLREKHCHIVRFPGKAHKKNQKDLIPSDQSKIPQPYMDKSVLETSAYTMQVARILKVYWLTNGSHLHFVRFPVGANAKNNTFSWP